MHDAYTKVKLFSVYYYRKKTNIISLVYQIIWISQWILWFIWSISNAYNVKFWVKFQLFYFAGISIPVFTMKIFYIYPEAITYIDHLIFI